MKRRQTPRVCCWCGATARGGLATVEHLVPRSLGLRPRPRPAREWVPARNAWVTRNSLTPWACGPCNWSRGATLAPPERATDQGVMTRLWREGMAFWLTACIPPAVTEVDRG